MDGASQRRSETPTPPILSRAQDAASTVGLLFALAFIGIFETEYTRSNRFRATLDIKKTS